MSNRILTGLGMGIIFAIGNYIVVAVITMFIAPFESGLLIGGFIVGPIVAFIGSIMGFFVGFNLEDLRRYSKVRKRLGEIDEKLLNKIETLSTICILLLIFEAIVLLLFIFTIA